MSKSSSDESVEPMRKLFRLQNVVYDYFDWPRLSNVRNGFTNDRNQCHRQTLPVGT